jgi:hypothetical protein
MCTSQTADLISEVVTEKVEKDEMFTAFDVSLDVKERARKEGVPEERHRHMKRVIHQEVEAYVSNGLYEKTLVDVGAGSPAFLYHPDGTDPNQYTPRTRKDAKPATTPTSGNVISDTAVDDDDEDDDDDDNSNGKSKARKGDKRGTLGVPNAFVRDAGFRKGQRVFAIAGAHDGEPALVLCKNASAPLTSYVVNDSDRVRVTAYILRKCQVFSKSGYEFHSKGDQVVVTAAN